MYCSFHRAERLTLMLINCVYSCWLLIRAGVVSWCWRLLLCIPVPCLPMETPFPVTWSLSLLVEPVEGTLGGKWQLHLKLLPIQALPSTQTQLAGHVCSRSVTLCSLTLPFSVREINSQQHTSEMYRNELVYTVEQNGVWWDGRYKR